MSFELSVLTLNVWGIPLFSPNRNLRIKAIIEELKKGLYDVVSLQEVWLTSDFELIKDSTIDVLPYSHYFYSGAAGSGLCFLSKYPLLSAFFHLWSVNGYFHRMQHGDWFGGKGVGLCRILVENEPVHIYIAHLLSEYGPDYDEYQSHRVIQAFDTAQFIQSTCNDSVLQVLAGDLNTDPKDIAFKLLLQTSHLKDTCNDNSVGTFDRLVNSYADQNLAEKNPFGTRIDHILYRAGNGYEVKLYDYKLPFPNYIPGTRFSYSDHEAVQARIKVLPSPFKSEDDTDRNIIGILENGIEICNFRLYKLRYDRIFYASMAALVAIVLYCVSDTAPIFSAMEILCVITKFLLCSILVLFLFMSTLWNTMERNGIMSGILSMKVALRQAKLSKGVINDL